MYLRREPAHPALFTHFSVLTILTNEDTGGMQSPLRETLTDRVPTSQSPRFPGG